MRTRTGKIARLPQNIRQQLNERLEECQPGTLILDWLHAQPGVQKLLAEEFGGDPVTKQNLSHWRHGGFRDWLAHEDIRSGLAGVDELTAEWQDERKLEIIDQATALLSARFATLLSRWDGHSNAEFEANARALNGLCSHVLRLQKQLHEIRHHEREMERQSMAAQKAEARSAEVKSIMEARRAKESNLPKAPATDQKNEDKPLEDKRISQKPPLIPSNVVQGCPTINFPPNEQFKISIP